MKLIYFNNGFNDWLPEYFNDVYDRTGRYQHSVQKIVLYGGYLVQNVERNCYPTQKYKANNSIWAGPERSYALVRDIPALQLVSIEKKGG